MVCCSICGVNATADLYSLGLIKRNTRIKITKTTVFILLPSAREMKREEESEGEKGQEGDGQCPAEAVLMSFPVLTEKLLTPDHRQATFKLGTRASEIK